MAQDKYSVERLNQALDSISATDMNLQKSGLRTINAALCRPFASSDQGLAEWAVADKTRDALISLLDSTPAKTIKANCFHAICNICMQIIDTGGNHDDAHFTAQCLKFKSLADQYTTSFLQHSHVEIRWRAALMCLHWGDAQGWDVICRHLSSSRLEAVITLIARTRDMMCSISAADRPCDVHGNLAKTKDLISHRQAVELKRVFIPLAEKENKKHPGEYTARRMNAAMQDLDDLIAKTAE